ncbi:MAG: TIGR02453 family protein [Candidatus Eremiobacterota bacterium]
MSHFRPAFFAFLTDLKANNRKDWFEENRKRYEEDVKKPLLGFIEDFAPHLAGISPHFVADSRSMFRIYRDVRFSRDKSPYKTHAAAQFRHEDGRDVHAPGFYLHLEPDSVFVGVGLYHPEPRVAVKVRDAIVAQPERWAAILGGRDFAANCRLWGESLKSVPRGYAPDHPHAEHLKRKDFIATREMSPEAACRQGFLQEFVSFCRCSSDYNRFLTESLGLKY